MQVQLCQPFGCLTSFGNEALNQRPIAERCPRGGGGGGGAAPLYAATLNEA